MSDSTAVTFLDYVAKYSWADAATITNVRPFLMIANLFVILLMIGVIVAGLRWHYQSPKGQRFHPNVLHGFLWPFFAGCLFWAAQYPLHTLSLVQVNRVHPDTLRMLLAEVCSTLTALSFSVAGLTLLRLPAKDRAHAFLPAIEHSANPPAASRPQVGVPILGASAGLLAVCDWVFLARALQATDSSASALVNAGTVLGNTLSCVALVTLGMGLLRELNKARVDPLGKTVGSSMILYGVFQLLNFDTSLSEASQHMPKALGALFLQFIAITDHLTLVVYTTGIFFKIVLATTLFGFFVMVVEARRARLSTDAAWRRLIGDTSWVAGVMARHMNARHELIGTIGLLRNVASRQTRANSGAREDADDWKTVLDAVDRQELCVKDFLGLDPLRVGVAPASIRGQELVSQIGAVAADFKRDGGYREISLRGELPVTELAAPVSEIREILHRILENGPREGAHTALIEVRLEEDLLAIFVSNDGHPFPRSRRDEVFLRRSGGLWVAQKLALDLGGDIAIVSNERESPRFRIRIPLAPVSERPNAAAGSKTDPLLH